MNWILLVGLGGVCGAVARHLVEASVVEELRDTLAVNVLGSLTLGAVVAAPAGDPVALAVGVGFCGAFTTFSTFALETLTSIDRGETRRAVGFAVANLLGALAAVALGAWAVGVVGGLA